MKKTPLSNHRQKYAKFFDDKTMNRFDMTCPDCKQGNNCAAAGGSERCFHCDNCDLVECLVTSPMLENSQY